MYKRIQMGVNISVNGRAMSQQQTQCQKILHLNDNTNQYLSHYQGMQLFCRSKPLYMCSLEYLPNWPATQGINNLW